MSLDPIAMPQTEKVKSPSSLTTAFLNQPPSCLEFCPAHPDYVVIGTYLLSEERKTGSGEGAVVKQMKTGSLQLWQLDATNSQL
jgi:diphthamide biosynthesis protein 7